MSIVLVVGITGGVGAGKSTILKYLKDKYSAVLLEADSIGRVLMMPGGETYQKLIDTYGTEILREDGTIDNLKVANIVFASEGKLASINDIVHPAVVSYMQRRIEKEQMEALVNPTDTLHLVIIEAAILFEGKADHLCDDIWYIHASKECRIERLMSSRGYSEEKCLSIMKNQMSDEEFEEKCSFTVVNEGELEYVHRQIDERIMYLEEEYGI